MQANHGGKAGWGNETHHVDVEMMETQKHPHLAPHALLILLDFLLGIAFSATSRMRSPGAVWPEGFRVAAEDSGVAAREPGVVVGRGEAWMDRLRGAQRGSTVLVVRVMSRSAICDDYDAPFVLLE